ncbi:MAG: GGDEF domain-containing protein [Burkholderiaceae bacterium]
MATDFPRLELPPGWRTELVRWGRWRVLAVSTAFAVLTSMALTFLLLVALGYAMDSRAMATAMLVAAVVPLVAAPLLLNLLVTLVYEMESTRAALHRLATRDSLTQTFNRRYFIERLEAEAMRATRTAQALAVLMIDADEFKSVNDRFGHATGDRVLQQIADACASSLRPYDTLARYGGEEFVVLLPDTTLQQACEVAERVLAAVRDMRLEMVTGEPLAISVSVGVAALASTDTGGSALLQRADVALYQAKRDGRNRWAC